jgi:hypothetical protein
MSDLDGCGNGAFTRVDIDRRGLVDTLSSHDPSGWVSDGFVDYRLCMLATIRLAEFGHWTRTQLRHERVDGVSRSSDSRQPFSGVLT